MRSQSQLTISAATAAALLIAIPMIATDAHAQGNSAGQGKGGGHGYGYGRGGDNASAETFGGSAGGAPLPFLGATVLGQAAGAGGLFVLWLRRRKRNVKGQGGGAG